MNESMHGPTVVAAMIRAAYLEGMAVPRNETPPDQQWLASKAKAGADQILKNAGDPTLVERLLGLWRAWANIKGDDPAAAFKKAGELMKQMRELVGPAPFDGGAKQEEKVDGC